MSRVEREDQFVDVRFHVQGDRIPVDHGYALFSALAHAGMDVHGNERAGIHPISGRMLGDRTMALTAQSRLTIRLPASLIGQVLLLAGKTLDLDGHKIVVGVPGTRALVLADRLFSRLVVIKGFTEPGPFLDAVRRQLAKIGARGEPALISTAEAAKANEGLERGTHSPWLRRTIRIRDKNIVGFALRVTGLDPESSIALQERGVGGRRRFGCGVFVAARER
jgi:CRISPR-associated protein Cas6